MILYHDAIARLRAVAARLPSERCAVGDALGRVLAAPVTSLIALPSFDHAAMDGYALAAPEPLEAGSEHVVHGSQAAGDAARRAEGGAWEIMTGARLPDGLDAVVAVERTELLDAAPDGTPRRIRLRDELGEGQNVRHAGVDVASGAIVLTAGTRLQPAQLMLLAAIGVPEVQVQRRPRVVVIGTGKELVVDPRQPLVDGQIYASNGPYLAAALALAGAQVLSCEVVDDTAVTYADALRRAQRAGADLVVSTGAVSMGRYDFVPEALRQLGASELFHKVAMRPGKPLLAATLPDGPLVMALPGTPMAVAAGMRFFVAPVLRTLLGQGDEPVVHALLDTPQQPKAGLRHFLRATFFVDAEGHLRARVMPQQQPFRILPFAQSDGWVVLDEDAGDCAAGRLVEVASLDAGTALPLHPLA
ncbi:gephyrin-like molybdotransferase Glp [Dyella sp.]|jgi:molybdopterin molybdotransferase|uniref:molybdopterin molybdotransferase MoeA n=1 Tax=Dyella sp. TaxID=1869338 RepID=UPI002D77BE65|nr:gephyrin-like molybdotransferase Glp [Dyella sp.]HET6432840.1 gephyrin-like molybdotransferase Glp [Dyella sp.]